MTKISEERRRQIAREYWRLYRRYGEPIAVEQLGVEYTLSAEELREIAAEFPEG